VNAFSNLDFIGIVEFESINRIENSYGAYESKIIFKELFKGNKKEKFIIDSQEGSSCSFMPETKSEYLILGYKNEQGIIEISFCSARIPPNEQELLILRKLSENQILTKISINLNQILKEEIDSLLFGKYKSGFFLYKVILNSDLTLKEITPENRMAKNHFNSKVRNELIKKIKYKKTREKFKLESGKLTSYIILNWTENYENKKIITTTKL
tara:strand:+ start:150 stop:785 length:636 start_codon:yes stop_codon:yes gene_type:complete